MKSGSKVQSWIMNKSCESITSSYHGAHDSTMDHYHRHALNLQMRSCSKGLKWTSRRTCIFRFENRGHGTPMKRASSVLSKKLLDLIQFVNWCISVPKHWLLNPIGPQLCNSNRQLQHVTGAQCRKVSSETDIQIYLLELIRYIIHIIWLIWLIWYMIDRYDLIWYMIWYVDLPISWILYQWYHIMYCIISQNVILSYTDTDFWSRSHGMQTASCIRLTDRVLTTESKKSQQFNLAKATCSTGDARLGIPCEHPRT